MEEIIKDYYGKPLYPGDVVYTHHKDYGRLCMIYARNEADSILAFSTCGEHTVIKTHRIFKYSLTRKEKRSWFTIRNIKDTTQYKALKPQYKKAILN